MCNSVIYEITTHKAQFFWKLTTSKGQLTFMLVLVVQGVQSENLAR